MDKKIKYLTVIILISLVVIISTMSLGVQHSNEGGSTIVPTAKEVVQEEVEIIEDVTQEETGITLAQLATHDDKTDCWVGFEDKVYDITSYLSRHPGGVNAIARHCGTVENFENAFAKKHGTRKVSLFMQVAVYMGDASIQ